MTTIFRIQSFRTEIAPAFPFERSNPLQAAAASFSKRMSNQSFVDLPGKRMGNPMNEQRMIGNKAFAALV